MDTLGETVTHAVANATLRVRSIEGRHALEYGEWRAVILRTIAAWCARKWIRAARRGYDDFGMGLPLFDRHRHCGRVWDY